MKRNSKIPDSLACKENRAINFLVIGFIWKQGTGLTEQWKLTDTFELGINAYTQLRNQGAFFNRLGIKRCNALVEATGVDREIFDGERQISVRGIEDITLRKYLYTLVSIHSLKEALKKLKKGEEINLATLNDTIKEDLSIRRVKEASVDEINKAINARKLCKDTFEKKLNKLIDDRLLNIKELNGTGTDFEKLLYYVKMNEAYGELSSGLEMAIIPLEKMKLDILEKAPLKQLEQYRELLWAQYRLSDALITIREGKN